MTTRKTPLLIGLGAIVLPLFLACSIANAQMKKDMKNHFFTKAQGSNPPKEKVLYDQEFGSQKVAHARAYLFDEFLIVHHYFRDLTESEALMKKESIQKGMDGGDSMLSPMNGFEVQSLDGKSIASFELRALPYGKHVFKVKDSTFEISNTNNQGLIVRRLLDKNH